MDEPTLYYPVARGKWDDYGQLGLFETEELAQRFADLYNEANREHLDDRDPGAYVEDPIAIVRKCDPIYTHFVSTIHPFEMAGNPVHTYRAAEIGRPTSVHTSRSGTHFAAGGTSYREAAERLKALMAEHGAEAPKEIEEIQ